MTTSKEAALTTKTLQASIQDSVMLNSNYSANTKKSLLIILDTLIQAPPKDYQQLFNAISTYIKEVPGAYDDSDLVYKYELIAQWNMRDIQEKEKQSLEPLKALSKQFDEPLKNIQQAAQALDRIKNEIVLATHVAKDLDTLLIISLGILKLALA